MVKYCPKCGLIVIEIENVELCPNCGEQLEKKND